MFGNMDQGKPQLKFESNPCSIDATDGRRYDGRKTIFDFMSSADIVKQT